MFLYRCLCIFICLFLTTINNIAIAEAKSLTEIRDEELERSIKEITSPILKAAGLPHDNIHIHIIKDKQINAFVAKGSNIFIYTGLLLSVDHIGQLAGVLAHETGHIQAGHLTRIYQKQLDAQKTTLASYILGVAGTLITGRPDVGMAVVLGTSGSTQQSLAKYRQSEENSADQIAANLLDKLQMSSIGLLEFMEKLQQNTIMSGITIPTYRRTHPLTKDRIEFLANHVAKSKFSKIPVDEKTNNRYMLAKAKLFAFIETPEKTFATYPKTTTSDEARYARAIAFHKKHDLNNALLEISSLLSKHPNAPYFLELKGQILFENGKMLEAITPYKKAVERAPDATLILTSLAHLYIELSANRKTSSQQSQEFLNEAIVHLKQAIKAEKNNAFAWKLRSIAHGRLENYGMAAYALAEYNILTGRFKPATFQAKKAKSLLKYGSIEWLRAEDIIIYTKNQEKQ
ncbi:MAG: M48 family metalloprotease [Alphaproteobacteria bacterium]|nr:M48 family metalloprotease [Alphaproteobacteria bacterium]